MLLHLYLKFFIEWTKKAKKIDDLVFKRIILRKINIAWEF